MSGNKNLIFIGIVAVVVGGGLLVWRYSKVSGEKVENCTEKCDSVEVDKASILTEDEYNEILSPEVIAVFQAIGEAAENSSDDAIEKTIANKAVIDSFVHSIVSLTQAKIAGMESKEDVKRLELDLFDQVCSRVRSEVGFSAKKDEFFDAYFHGLREKTLLEEKS